ncbi:MAG: ATP-binding cassette domain-containing protein [Acidobacteriota bacterium]
MILFKKTSWSLNGRPILRDLDLQVRQGETFVLLGRSGCGKTTTLKMVNRLLEPEHGEVLVERRPTTSWDPIKLRRRVGYVIQEVGLFPHYTVEKNVGLVPRLEGWEEDRIGERVREMLLLVGLEPHQFGARYPHQLSGGQRQRVGVARALAVDPPILLMDEPFGALDPLTRGEIQREFKELQRELRKTILFVTHDLSEAFLLGDRVGLMDKGTLLLSGTPEELLCSDQAEIRAFIQPLKETPLTGSTGGFRKG